MMRSTAARSNRSSLHNPRLSPIPTSSATSSIYQQQILYAPINNPMIQPCGTAPHPSCVYPNGHLAPSNSVPIYLQGKTNRWHSKNKPSRGQQYYQQQQFSYNPKPTVFFEQPSSSIPPIPPSTTSFLVASSTFTHVPLPSEHYNSSGMTLLPQPYFKPPDMQAFCIVQDRQNTQQQQQHPMHASYYNISATNTCSLQTINTNSSFPLSNLSPYTSLTNFTNNQFPTSVQSSPLFSNPSIGLILGAPPRDKPLSLSTLEFSPFKHNTSKIPSICESQIVPIGHNEKSNDWPSQIEMFSNNSHEIQTANNNRGSNITDCPLQKPISDVNKTDDEHCSDESSISFDFSIEAEKMVSALCNTTSSNDLGKEESKADKTDSTPLFSGAGDNVSNNVAWFADFCPEYENGTSIGIQTDSSCADRSQYPELIRKMIYWGCTEAEVILNSDISQTDSKWNWLTCLSSATRTAITKSSTCIPVFAGNRVFANDLINALLRVSNGWLSLDNYLNKQHFPSVLDKLDPEFITCFHTWEENTYELLKQIVQTFQKLKEHNEVTNIEQKCKETYESSSFPGDVSLYTNCDLFVPFSSSSLCQQNLNEKPISQDNSHNAISIPSSTNSLCNFQYNTGQQEQQSVNHKESKLRSKWTITGNLSSTINSTKSVPNVSVCRAEITNISSNKLRTRDTSSPLKFDLSQKSLNAEFFQLKSKVMESNTSATRQLRLKDRKQGCPSDSKFPRSLDNTESVKLQNSTMNTPISYSGLYARNCLSFTFPLSNHSESLYSTPNPGLLTYESPSYLSSEPRSITNPNSNNNKNYESSYGAAGTSVNPLYEARTSADHVEFPIVPKNKMTLLSQIEPRTFEKESEEMAANLSAWFASMRNAQPAATIPAFQELKMNDSSAPQLFTQPEIPKYSTNVLKQPQADTNRQFQALQNLQNIQSTPWAAGNFIVNRSQMQQVPEEYDSSEDVRVYMKPGSYNVPKKRHQRKPNRRSDNNATSRNVHTSNHHNMCGNKGKNILILTSSTTLPHINMPTLSTNINNATLIKTSFPPASQLPTPTFNLVNSPRILKRVESLPRNDHRDVTWKAACASAEILLEALNVKDCINTFKKDNCNDCIDKDDSNKNNTEALSITSQPNVPKSAKHNNVDCASSYEASEDDSESTCGLSPSTSNISIFRTPLSIKANVKTDSWLIRTLNNASIKQKRCKNDVDRQSLESSNSSEIVDVKPNRLASSSIANIDGKIPATIIDSEYPAISSRERSCLTNDETSTKEFESHAGKATYSETVRNATKPDNIHLKKKELYKSCNLSANSSSLVSVSTRKCQKKDAEQSYQLLYKSRKSVCKKTVRNVDNNDLQPQEESCTKVNNVKPKPSVIIKMHGRKKNLECIDNKYVNKSSDRGWSVWYSSRRKQSLNPLALSKLETIYHTIWQMDEANIFEHAFLYDKDNRCPSTEMVEDYSKIIDYKLKNRIYHKVEDAVRDFRHAIHNARLYHQHDSERAKKVEILSKKLEDLLEEFFGDWDNILRSPRENSPVQQRFQTTEQKPIA